MLKYKLLGLVLAMVLLGILGIQCARNAVLSSPVKAELVAAIMKAQKRLPEFEARLEHPESTDKGFFVRASFPNKDHVADFLWLKRVRRTRQGFTGVVAEPPAPGTRMSQGEEVTVSDTQVIDWTILRQDNTREGNFTEGLEPNAH